ncbi:hypothetical protein FHS57_005061 [Runella defluvii]|uniref:Novel STAND NTPase 1 domain-containing protein n=1 Tax=Runella defluvii TaxID=370973 RepID=A0A7W5ZP39_9BACT|nr:hypothetical protein [Runella defluvii]MBB3841040.1 hypothetical protein [Runella defluvii]
MQERSTPRNRYPGVKPFNTEEREAFFGRERETEELFRLVYVKQVVVLYAKSGFGKSSLLNAGIIPKLLDDSAYHPLTIRFTNRSTQEADTGLHPIDTLKIRLQNELDISLPSPVSQLTNDDNSLWHWLKTWQNLHSNKGLILLFDQFEELFTYSPEAISTFSEELAEALYSPIPLKYRRRLAELSKTKQLDVAFHDFLYQKPDLKIVFSIRTDRLALLNQLTDRHPAILQHCYELMPLRADQAEAALTQPAALPATDYDSPPFDYAPEAIEAILDSILKNGQVEATSVLQIVGRHTESKLVLAQGKTYITANDLGPVKDIIQNYYEDILQTLAPADRDNAQQLIEEKLISGQLRNPLSEAYIRQEFGISEALLQTLENSTLLRTERDAAGRLLYEISHDTLVEPIQQVAQERLAVEAAARQRQLEQEQNRQLQAEKQRADQLDTLNQTIRARGRVAWAVAAVALVVAAVAGYFWRSSIKAKATADAALQAAQANLRAFSYQKALEFYTKASQYLEYQEYHLAQQAAQQAKLFLATDVASSKGTTTISFTKDVEAELAKKIDKQIDECKQRLKQP